MPFPSDRPETRDRDATEYSSSTSGDSEQANDFVSASLLHSPHKCAQRRLRDRVRIVTLDAEVAMLERECSTLSEENTALEADIESLEEEVATLEETIERKDHRLQRVIDRYERITNANDLTEQGRNGVSERTVSARDRRPMATIRSLGSEAIARLKRLLTD